MKYHRFLTSLRTTRSLLLCLLALSPNVFGAESVLIRDEEGFAEMPGNSDWREGASGSTPPASSLLFDNPQRRRSAQWHRGTHRITGFGLPAASGEEQPGNEPQANETAPPRGLSWSASPAKLREEELTITGTYIHTPGTDSPDDSPSGSAGAVAIDSRLPARGTVHLHGELAYSRFDPDGSSDGFDAAAGRALAGELSWLPQMKGPTRVRLIAGWREVGPDFRSAANPGLREDQRRTHLGASLDRKGFSLQGEVSRTLDNVSEEPSGPVTRTDALRLRGEYAAPPTGTADGGFFLFDNPRLSFGIARNRTQDQGNATGLRPTDRGNTTIDFSMAFNPGPAKWSFDQSLSRQEDDTDFHLDQLTRKSRLQAAVSVRENLHLSSTLQQSRKAYENGYGLDETSAAFRLSLSGEKGRRTSFSLKHERKESSDGSLDESRLSADVRVDRPLPSLPGEPRIWIGGSYETLASRGRASDSGYNVFLGLELKLGTTG